MRFGLSSLLALPLSVAMLSIASAAFTFSLNPQPAEGTPGSIVNVDLFATNTDASPFPDDLNFFSVTLVPDGGNDPDITLLNPTIEYNGMGTPFFGGGGVLSGDGGVVGTFQVQIGPDAVYLDAGSFAGNINSQAFNNPFVITSQPLVLNATAIPEPSVLGMLAAGGLGLVVRRRRRA